MTIIPGSGLEDFGVRWERLGHDGPCGDCDERGHCTMNCGPAVPPGPPEADALSADPGDVPVGVGASVPVSKPDVADGERTPLKLSERLRQRAEDWRAVYRTDVAREWDRLADEVARLEAQLDARAPCAHCGGDNPRAGLYCSDRCRSAHARMHAPDGKLRTVRRLARGKAGVVIHFDPEEADRVMRLKVGERVYIVQEE